MPKTNKGLEPLEIGSMFGRPDLERIGLFAEMPYMNGKGYVSPYARKKADHLKGLVCPGNKILDGTQAALFEKEFKRIFEKEAIVRTKKRSKEKDISSKPFIPFVGSKVHATPGDYFGCFSGIIPEFSPKTRPQKTVAESKKIPFLSNPGKKGGPGYADITISKYPIYEWSRYGQKPKYKQYGAILDGPMKTVIYPQPFFDPNPYPDPPKMKKGRVYIRPKEIVYGKLRPPGYIVPTGPAKWPGGMHAGGFSKFPEYKPDRYKSVYEALKPKREEKVFYPQSMANKSYYNTSIVNQNVDFRLNIDNHLTFEPTYLKYIATRLI